MIGLRPERARAAAALAAGVLAFVTFLPALENEFVYDDNLVILANPAVTGPASWRSVLTQPYWPPLTSADRLYRPLITLAFRLNALATGGKPEAWAFHLVNLALHAFASAAVALLAARTTRSPAAALVAGCLFATHPIHTEAVATGYGLSEILVGLFGAVLLARHVQPPTPAGLRPARERVTTAMLFLAALMSKEHAFFLWPVLVLLDIHHLRTREETPPWPQRLGNTARAHLGYALAAGLALALRLHALGPAQRLSPAAVRLWENPLAQAGIREQVLTPLKLLWLTVEMIARPRRLCPVWSYPALSPASALSADVLAGGALLVAALATLFWLWRRRSIQAPLLAGVLILLALPLHVVPGAQWIFADRWLYLPTVPLAALVGTLALRLRPFGAAAGLLAALALVPSSRAYTRAFHDDVSMNREVVRRQPESFQGRRNLAIALLQSGHYPEAIEQAQETLARYPVSDPYWVLINAYLALGDGPRARSALETFLRLRPDIPPQALEPQRQRAERLLAAPPRPR